MSEFFIDRPVFATVLAILITLTGAIALLQLPIARFPQITPPSIVVSTSFPGADAATIEQSVAAPIEQQVNGVPNMLYMDSRSASDGSYTLTVTFEVGTDQDIAAVDVQNQVSIAQRFLPQEVVRQGVVVAKRQPQILMVVSVRATDPRYDYLFLSNFAKLNLYDTLARVKGVGQVTVFGARDYGMRIWLDPQRMAQLGVTTQDVSSVLNEQNLVAPAGLIGAEPAPPGQQLQYTVSMHGRLSTVSEYQNILVRARPDGSNVRLKDIARVELAATDYSRSSRLNGEPSVMMGVYQLPDANALDVARQVHKTVEELSKSFPPGIEAGIPLDITQFVSESVREVIVTLLVAAFLVLLVVFVFLGNWRTTLIPMLAVPVSLIGSFSAFAALGFSINTLTLFALVLAIGLVVDDAIVVVEAVVHKMEVEHVDARSATRAAMREVQGPVIAIALVLIAVFVPVAFLGGLTGQFYRQFALTLSMAVLISAIIALTFTPALCALLLQPHKPGQARRGLAAVYERFNRGFTAVSVRYRHRVALLVTHRRAALAGFALIALFAAVLVWLRPAGFLPDEDQGYMMTFINLPPGASQQRTEEVVRKFLAVVREQVPEVQDTVSITGFSIQTGVTSSYAATAFLVLKPWSERGGARHSSPAVRERLMKALAGIPQATFMVMDPPAIPGIGQSNGFEFVLQDRSGGSLLRFASVLRDFIGQANARRDLSRVFTPFSANVPQIEYVLDRERAKTLGVSIADVFGTLQTFLGGNYINDFNLFGRTFRVTAQAEGAARATPDAVAGLYVRAATGDMVPLSTLVTIRPKEGPEYIERYNIYRAATINGTPGPGRSSAQAIAAMQALGAGLPEGFGYDWTGVTFQEIRAGAQAPYVFAMALVFVFLVLAALYESWVVPFAVLLGIPLAILGAFAALSVRGMANDIYVQVGLVMLIGLAAKNAILIVEFAQLARERGKPLIEAALEGAQLRLRPILMTSFAFILGSLPLAVATGAGAGARQVLGTTVVFGMLAATLLGVFLVPVFYVALENLARRWGKQRPAAEKAS
ncbi:MAG: multidrug efflux RND transporter permease subunit [Proteobacteria bacterium]|nr:multidrug efflux RND transporter permease subunit [Pseudomonadota bacterium]